MKELFKALANFQQEVPVIHKGTQGYGYSYADLPAIFETINPLLKKNGLGFTQLMEGQSLRTTIFHVESGESLSSVTDIPQNVSLKGMNDFQVLGSAITYIRRYALSSALGLVTDKDTDAGGQQTQKPVEKNIQSPSADVLNKIAKGLSEVNTQDALIDLSKNFSNEIKTYPSIKSMFTSKKIAINGN